MSILIHQTATQSRSISHSNIFADGLQLLITPELGDAVFNGIPVANGSGSIKIGFENHTYFDLVYPGTNDFICSCKINVAASVDRTLVMYASNAGSIDGGYAVVNINGVDQLFLGATGFNVNMDLNPSPALTISESSTPRIFAGRRRSNQVSCWTNGNASSESVTGTRGISEASITIGRGTGNTVPAQIYYVAYFNRYLTDTELNALNNDPWQLFKYNEDFFVYSSSGATTYTKTATLNSLLQKLQLKTADLDSRLLKAAIVKNANIGAQLSKISLLTSGTDSVLLKSVSRLIDADARLLKNISRTSDISSQLSKTNFNYTSLDSNVLKSEVVSLIIDANILKTITTGIGADANLSKLVDKITQLDSVLSANLNKVTQLDSRVSKEINLLSSLDSILVNAGAGILFASIDSKIKKENILLNVDLNASLSKMFLLDTAVFDSKLSKIGNLLSSLDAYLIGSSQGTVTTDLTSLLNKNISAVVDLDALIRATREVSVALTSFIVLRAQLQNNIDAALMRVQSKSISIGAYIRTVVEYVDVYINVQIKAIDNQIKIETIDNNFKIKG